jgi:hypothetical protein
MKHIIIEKPEDKETYTVKFSKEIDLVHQKMRSPKIKPIPNITKMKFMQG